MATYDKMISPNGRKVQVESAIRDGSGKNIENNYAKQDGAYENLYAGNLITDQNWRWVNDFEFGTGTVDTVFDGEATIYAIRGRTEWNETTPSYVNIVSNKSVMFNLFNPSLGYAHVVGSDNENNGLCIYGTGITISNILEFSETSDFASSSDIIITEETNSMGETYLNALVPSDGYVRIKNTTAPSDLCIANVWGGNRVNYHPAYEEAVVTIDTASYFATGMKSIWFGGEEVVYDEMYANKYYARVLANTFGATPSVSYQSASGSYNIYRMSLSNAMKNGACQIGGSTKFAWANAQSVAVDSMWLTSGYIYFSIAQSEDTSYTYSEDTAVVDSESFETQKAIHNLYKLVDTEYVLATEYEADTTYYYISATNLHGLNGKAITDEIANKTIVYQRYSMDKTVYTGTAISPAKDWSYKMGDFGTEELTLASGYPVVPNWVVYYPINVVETVQQLPNNYVSLESAEEMLHQVGEMQGFDFDSISVDEETGNVKVNGLVDTKETIHLIETIIVGYELLTQQPQDWFTNYTNYYKNIGTLVEPNYTQLTQYETFEIGKYYSFNSNGINKISRIKEPNGEPYYFDKLLALIYCPANTRNVDCMFSFVGSYASLYQLTLWSSVVRTSNTYSVCMYERINDKLLKVSRGQGNGYNYDYGTHTFTFNYFSEQNTVVRQFNFGINNTIYNLPANSTIRLYGLRAKD